MKRLCFCIFVLISFVIKSQKVGYTFDGHGNRTQRKLVVTSNNNNRFAAPKDSTKNSSQYDETTMKLAMEYGVSVFPNPTQTDVSIVANKIPTDSKANAVLFDNAGKILQTFNNIQNKEEIPLSNYKSGIYYITITVNEKDHLNYKVIKQ